MYRSREEKYMNRLIAYFSERSKYNAQEHVYRAEQIRYNIMYMNREENMGTGNGLFL